VTYEQNQLISHGLYVIGGSLMVTFGLLLLVQVLAGRRKR
jgi:hypothetical protein